MNTITVEALASELGVTVRELSIQVTRLCKDPSWGPQQVVAHAVADNGACQLHVAAADEIRELLTAAVAA